MRAIEAASDALFCREAVEGTTAEQRRADALGLLAERALAVGFGGGGEGEEEAEVGGSAVGGPGPTEGHGPDSGEGAGTADEVLQDVSAETSAAMSKRDTDREADGPGLTPAPLSGSRAERYQVFLHVDVETLRKDGEGVRSNLEDGMRVSAEPQDGRAKHGPTSRRLSCDCSTVKVVENGDGRVLDIGRRTRSIPPAIRRALQVRDQGCRWPGCGLRFTHGHHIEHWIDGGETSLRNLISLCHFHHRKVHEDGWAVCYNQKDDTALFFGPRGMVRAHRPARLGGGRDDPDPVLDLIAENRRHGAHPRGLGCAARHLKPRRLPWEEWS